MNIGHQVSPNDFHSPVSRWQALTCVIPALIFAIAFDKFIISGHLMLVGFSTLITGICLLIFRRVLRFWVVPTIILAFFSINIILSLALPAENNSLPGIVFVPAVLIEFSIVYIAVNAALKYIVRNS